MTLDDRSLREHLDRRAEAGLTDVAQTADVVLARVAEIDRGPWWRRLGVRGPSLGIAAGAVAVLVVALAVLPPRLWPGPGSSPTSSGPAAAAGYPANRPLTAGELRTLLAGDTARLADAILVADVELREAAVSCQLLALCATFAIDGGNPASPIYVMDPHGVAFVGAGTYALHVLGESSVTLLGRVRPGFEGLGWTLPQLTAELPNLRGPGADAAPLLYLIDAWRVVSTTQYRCRASSSGDFGCGSGVAWLLADGRSLPSGIAPSGGLRVPNASGEIPEDGGSQHGFWLVDPFVLQEDCFLCPPAGAADLIGRVPNADELGLAPADLPAASVAPPTTEPSPTADTSETGVHEITFSTDLVRLNGFETADLTVTVSFAADVVPYHGADASLTPLLHLQRDAGDTGDPLDPHIAQLTRTMRESPVAGLWTATFRLTSGDRGIWHVDGLVAYDADGRELDIGPAIRDLSPKLEVVGTDVPHLTMAFKPSPIEVGQALEVFGQVADEDTGDPLGDVVVTIGRDDACGPGGTGSTVTTNPNGAYTYLFPEANSPLACAWISGESGAYPSFDSDIPIALYGALFGYLTDP